MFISNIILCALVVWRIENVYGKVCRDCIVFQSCPEAAKLAVANRNEDSSKKFLESFCGYEYVQSTRVQKVCCSDFVAAAGDGGTTATKDAIETHPNINLLPDSCGYIDGNRIIGGRTAKLYEFPWMALISHRLDSGFRFQCGGSIINSKYILTAAHCVPDSNIVAGVRIGELDVSRRSDCQGEFPFQVCERNIQDIRVEKIISHPNYTTVPSPQNDIALLRLSKPINFTYKNALPICLPVSQKLRNVEVGDKIATVAGWGLTEAEIISPVLLKVLITIKSGEHCKDFLNSGDNEQRTTKLCAGGYLRDSCKGDSGGPLMLEDIHKGKNKYIQYGIVSYGPSRCGSANPGVYTDVTKYMDWILDNMKE